MSWHALTHGFLGNADQTNIWAPIRLPVRQSASARSLGTATAEARWRWASPHGETTARTMQTMRDDEPPVAARLRVTKSLRVEMAEMAEALGRSEDDIWAEAAREWLMRRLRNDEPPPTTPAAAPIPNVRTRRLWDEIDTMLANLRHPRQIAAPAEPTAPAA